LATWGLEEVDLVSGFFGAALLGLAGVALPGFAPDLDAFVPPLPLDDFAVGLASRLVEVLELGTPRLGDVAFFPSDFALFAPDLAFAISAPSKMSSVLLMVSNVVVKLSC
jgi:hypothetical protein